MSKSLAFFHAIRKIRKFVLLPRLEERLRGTAIPFILLHFLTLFYVPQENSEEKADR